MTKARMLAVLMVICIPFLGGCVSTGPETSQRLAHLGGAVDGLTRTVSDLAALSENEKFAEISGKVDAINTEIQTAIPALQESIARDGTIDPQAAGAAAGGIANVIVPGSGGAIAGLVVGLAGFFNERKKKIDREAALEQTVRAVEAHKSNGITPDEAKSLKTILLTTQDAKTKKIIADMRRD